MRGATPAAIEYIQRLADHCLAADAAIAESLRGAATVPETILREYAHILGAEETWLARIEGRAARAAIWPSEPLAEILRLRELVAESYRAHFAQLGNADLARLVEYRNSAGISFSTSVGDILFHVMLHGQYHRGKVNLLLRQSGLPPVPTDYIAFVRGVPAATQADATRVNIPHRHQG
ncbi:MAG TPA: DinB family protein [Gemmatimonadaceae bacterium]|nr:DinB family protein [Gemmatimonadaceae bacterium]